MIGIPNTTGNRSPIPPGPKGLPFIGSVRELKRDPLEFLTNLAQEYGDVAKFRIGRKTIYQFNHPDAIRDILVTKHRCFEKTGLILQTRPILGNGLLTSGGEVHRRQRRMIQPSLSRKRVMRYAGIVTECAERMMEDWCDGRTIDIYRAMLELTIKIIARSMFNVEIDSQARELEQSVAVAIEYFDKLLSPNQKLLSKLPTAKNRRYREAKRHLDEFVYQIIQERRASENFGEDVLSQLILARDEEGDRSRMSDQQVRDEIITLLAAGHETIANALTWSWYLLGKHPEIERQLHDQVTTVLGDRVPTAEDLDQLTFARSVLAESMRLYPPLWALSRKCVEECEIGGYQIPLGTIVGVSQYVTHRDDRYYERPEAFDPSRWDQAEVKTRPKFSYFPFGGGPRLCIGEPLAWMEGTLLIAAINRQWRFEFSNDFQADNQPLITLRPKNGMPATIRSISNS